MAEHTLVLGHTWQKVETQSMKDCSTGLLLAISGSMVCIWAGCLDIHCVQLLAGVQFNLYLVNMFLSRKRIDVFKK